MEAVVLGAALTVAGYLARLLSAWLRERAIQQRVQTIAALPPGSHYSDIRAGVKIQIGPDQSLSSPADPGGR
ncbi:hypothetical protein [Nonomuraea typhae]|uniref:hypothetical protein n=1 Tax=Nonomuraea typhae TaxID=2603600 RepID=UPI0012F814FF|nr:hypothetical protein [Nonomuraea typhae]